MNRLLFKGLYFYALFMCWQINLTAQEDYRLSISAGEGEQATLSNYRYNKAAADSISAENTVKELLSSLHNDGYLLATISNKVYAENSLAVQLSIGERFEWLGLQRGNLDKAMLRRSGFREERFDGRPFRYQQVARVMDQLVSYAERHGHPFARVTIDSLHISQNQLGGVLNFDPGAPINFDSIDVKADFRIKSKFLGNNLGIRLGDPFDQNRIDRLGRALAGLPYLRVSENPRLTFQNSEATLHLNLKRRKVNQIDGIIGFLPDANNDGALLVTGQFDLLLYNPFGTGKKIGVHWRRQNVESQTLRLEYDHPNLFGTQLSTNVDFNLLKQDTTFISRDFRLDLNYRIGANGLFSVFTRQQNTDRISTVGLSDATVLPDVLNLALTSYGLGFRFNSLDDFFLPRKGLSFQLNASAGNKKISPDAALSADLLRGLDLKNLQYQFDLSFEKHSPIGERLVLLNRLEGGLILNDQLFRNDAFRIGGLNSIRGFNEYFFFATRYLTTTLEGRLFFDSLSYFTLFADYGFLYDGFAEVPSTDNALGLGAGISFSTDAGIFNFIYALGRSDQSGPLTVNQSKIHFGFTSRF